ncbi:hypothetical protein B1A99_02770 [Cohnella sp. CIP 111063]|jgi:hypothetical protein|uniref:DUF2269 family protein n=1 Tax=unclassified Cohnella TaxID=2636738 RepID=UPI000B8BC728|nr:MULTISPECIES: hypothetical protein [unclassified Cohnella]OXS62788.1 hypothetical protein B1A99_02770 [Cohnella sp. CIP 111063]PRX75070.1 hypothetical protein B0G52_101569 [Cohnella sp. SGD-V74]
MANVMLFLHVVGAVGMGVYAILPFVAGKFKQLSGTAQEGLARGLISGGRIGQYALVLQLITGGYLLTGLNVSYAVSWIVTVGILFLAIGALSGIVQGPLKRIAEASVKGESASASISKVQTLSTIIFVLFLVIIWFMQVPWYKA